MKLLIIPLGPLLVLAAIDWTSNTGSAPEFLARLCHIAGRWWILIIVLLLLIIERRTRPRH